MKKLLFIIFLTLIIYSCKKEENNTSHTIVFRGYCPTDINGFVLSDCDSSDWVLDTKWEEIEKNLFTDYNQLIHKYEEGFNGCLYFGSGAYPNPIFEPEKGNYSRINLNLQSPINYVSNINLVTYIKLDIIIVDSLFNKIYNNTHSIVYNTYLNPDTNTIIEEGCNFKTNIDFSDINISNKMIRIYYMYTKNDTCIHKAHGDIKIGPGD